MILQNPDFVDHQLRKLIDKLVLQSKREKKTKDSSVAPDERHQRIPPNSLLPIKHFRLPRDFGQFGSDVVAVIFFWLDSKIYVDTCFDPDRRRPMSVDYSGGEVAVDHFLRILRLNPEMRRHEFGITGKPSCILIVFPQHGEVFGFIGSYKLLETLRGEHEDRMRKIIRLLI